MHAVHAFLRGGRLVAAALCCLLALGPAGTQAAPEAPKYEIRNLGRLPGMVLVEAMAINDQGSVVGYGKNRSGLRQAFIVRDGEMQPLPALAGGHDSLAFGINSLDVATGVAENATGQLRAVVFRDGQAEEFFGLPLTNTASGYAINDADTVVGMADSRPYIHDAVGTRWIDIPGSIGPVVQALNNAGQVLLNDYNQRGRFYIYDNGRATTVLGIGEPESFLATDINDAGQIVGYAFINSRIRTFIYSGGRYRLLPDPTGGLGFQGLRINNRGWVVGNRLTGERVDPFLYRNGVMYDLRSLMRPASASHWLTLFVRDMNDRGQIIGVGSYQRVNAVYLRSFIASPVPQNPTPGQ